MPGRLQVVQERVNLLVEERLAQNVEKDGGTEAEVMELAEETLQAGFGQVLLRPAEDIRRAERAMHVAGACQLEENRPRRIGDRGGPVVHGGLIID